MTIDEQPDACPECGTLPGPVRHGPTPRCGSCGYFRVRLPTVGVAMVVRDRGGRVLLGRRTRGSHSGSWCIPCGRLEWGEDVRRGAERELLEETGLTAVAGAVVSVQSNFHDAARQTVGIWFEAEDVAGEAWCPDGEFDEVGYFDPATPPELAFPTDGVVLADLAERRRMGQ